MRFSEVARWLVGKTIARVDWVEAPMKDGARMTVDTITFTDGTEIELGGHGLLATIDYVQKDGKEIQPWADPDPDLDPLWQPASRIAEDFPLDAKEDKKPY